MVTPGTVACDPDSAGGAQTGDYSRLDYHDVGQVRAEREAAGKQPQDVLAVQPAFELAHLSRSDTFAAFARSAR